MGGLVLKASAATTVWFNPTALGDGSGSSAVNAKAFSSAYINDTLLGNAGDLEVTINLVASGTPYSVSPAIRPSRTTNLDQLKVRIRGQGTSPKDVILRNEVPPNAQKAYVNPDYTVFINGVAEVGLENLVVDGNWSWKLDPVRVDHPSQAQTYKNQPVNLYATQGVVSSVVVRNFGAAAVVPFHRFADSAGTEAFPMVVGGADVGQGPLAGRSYPWEVEDCEVHGFTGTYGGYATFIMAHGHVTSATPAWAKNSTTRRLVIVRRCQLRGLPGGVGVIGLGTAAATSTTYESGRVLFTDNVIVNAYTGYNVDTGVNRNVEFIDSLGLNVVTWARIEASIGYLGLMENFRIDGNAVRLGPLSQKPIYRSFCNATGGTVSDPSLVLGRPETNQFANGLSLGSVKGITFANNWFTTVPHAQFFTPIPGDPLASVFKVIQKWGPQTLSCDTPAIPYVDGANVTNGINRLSSTAWEFTSLADMNVAASFATFGVNTLPALQTNQPALVPTRQSFVPAGQVQRVLPVWDNATPQRKLVGAYELVPGVPSVAGNSLTLPVLLTLQRTPFSGQAGSQPGNNQTVWLQINEGTPVGQVTDVHGLTTFNVNLPAVGAEWVRLRVFHRTDGQTTFDEYRCAWATSECSSVPMITVAGSPDVAVDRRDGGVQTAKFRLTRSGPVVVNAANYPSRTIRYRLNGTKPRAASFGGDYTVTAVSPATRAQSTPADTFTATFAAAQKSLELLVTPVEDSVIEEEVVWFELLPALDASYTIGPAAEAQRQVYLYDGPEWLLLELGDATAPYGVAQSRAAGLNNDVNGSGQPNPKVAGSLYLPYTNAYGQVTYGWKAAWWQGSFGTPQARIGAGLLPAQWPVPTGISDSDPVSGVAYMPGYQFQTSGNPRAVFMDAGGWSYLNVPNGNWYSDYNKALCISPNRQWVGGYATAWKSLAVGGGTYWSFEQKPVYWVNGVMTSLIAGDPVDGFVGEALAVNSSGEFVGGRQIWDSTVSLTVTKAFRSRASGVGLDNNDFLPVPAPPPGYQVEDPADTPSLATSVIEGVSGSGGEAYGRVEYYHNQILDRVKRPIRWVPRGVGQPNPTGSLVSTAGYLHGSIVDACASGVLVGWIRMDQGLPVPCYWKNSSSGPFILNDAHRVAGVNAGTQLTAVVKVSSIDTILVEGTKQGGQRGFVLARQILGN